MAVVFLLGPGMWDSTRRAIADPTPMQVRRSIGKILKEHGHRVILMEDDPNRGGEDYIEKFDRLLRDRVTDVVLYWPPAAKMQTTYDELILLCDRRDYLKREAVRLWALHHSSVATIKGDGFKVLETGNRSRYLTAVARLGLRPLEWNDEKELAAQARLLAAEL
ncbi:MAG: hypothetical protein HYY18_15535 [Planctomycetes bacterium]|nr:hypothetical protein [Planctomycetota bacterium]